MPARLARGTWRQRVTVRPLPDSGEVEVRFHHQAALMPAVYLLSAAAAEELSEALDIAAVQARSQS